MTGGRVVVYVDDLKVEGEVPSAREFEVQKTRNWATVKRATDARVADWGQTVSIAEQGLNALGDLPTDAVKLKAELEARLRAVRRDVSDAKLSGFITRPAFGRVEPFLREIDSMLFNIRYLAAKGSR